MFKISYSTRPMEKYGKAQCARRASYFWHGGFSGTQGETSLSRRLERMPLTLLQSSHRKSCAFDQKNRLCTSTLHASIADLELLSAIC
jgi:hypothetical protein